MKGTDMRVRESSLAVLAAGVMLLLGSSAALGVSRGVRGTTATSVNRGGSVNTNINRNNVDVNRNVDVKRNLDANRDLNMNRNVGVSRDINAGVDPGYGRVEHPVAAAAVVGAAVAVTAAAIGSVVYTVPSDCEVVYVNGVCYNNCNGTWYQPQLHGDDVEYTVVPPPN